MKLVIAEKPSVARDIASVIGATNNKGEWYEGKGYVVTWLFGHLLELSVPESARPWTAENLPIIPQKFGLTPILFRTQEGRRQRIDVVRQLFDECDSIIVATDAGREGELIFRNLYEYLHCRKPFKRLWINSLTEKAIRNGFMNLIDGHEFDNLAVAAKQRNQADWLIGINATRAFSVSCGCSHGIVLSLGGVQTPALCMICDRYVENRTFKPNPFWYIEGEATLDDRTVKFRSTEKFFSKEEAGAAFDAVAGNGVLRVVSVSEEKVTEAPPLLFDIDALQKEANVRCGMTLDASLAAAQSLYERKFISYPRTSSRYIPEDVFFIVPELMKVAAADGTYGHLASDVALSGVYNRRSVDDAKITDHHALIITENMPLNNDLTQDERNVYDLVLSRFIEAFSPVCVVIRTKIELESAGVEFSVSGRRPLSLGWRAVNKVDSFEDVELDDIDMVEFAGGPLPKISEGEEIRPVLQLCEDKTRPKPLLTDATLLTAMENAGRKSDDKAVADALRDVGIGTAATRSETLKTLVERGYVFRSNRHLSPTDLGLEVFVAVRDMAIANVEMTARWEIALEGIKNGETDSSQFENAILNYTSSLTKEILKGETLGRLKARMAATIADMAIRCPACGFEMRLGDKSAYCNKKEGGCGLTIWRTVAKKRLSDRTMRTLIKDGRTGLLSGFVSKNGNEFEASLRLDPEYKIQIVLKKRG